MLTDRAVEMVLGAGAVTVIAMLAAWTALAERRRSLDSSQWRRTQGIVLTSRVTAGDGRTGMAPRPAITYEYQVDDEIFEGFVVNFGTEFVLRPRQARAMVARHPVGSAVQVWYDPDKPADSVLYRRRRTAKLWFFAGLATLFAAKLWNDALPWLLP